MNKEAFLSSINSNLDKFNHLKVRFEKKEIHLSYSKLKNLDSPINFTKGLLEKKVGNVGMSFGTLVDTYITQRSSFDSKYQVKEIKISSGNQTEVVSKVLLGDINIPIQTRFENAFKDVYSKGKISDYGHLLEYCTGIEMGITYITQEDYDKAVFVADALKLNEEASFLISSADEMQHKIEFEYRGWKFVCYLDLMGDTWFADLKYESQFNPSKFRFSIEKYGYDIQQAVYYKAMRSNKIDGAIQGKFIVYDDKGNNAVMNFGDDYMQYSLKKLDVYINRLNLIIKEDAWFESYDFFTPNRTIGKPAFIDGFSENDLRFNEE